MEAEQQLWENIKGELELSISPTNYNMLIKLSKISELSDETVVISSPNVFVQNNLARKCQANIVEALKHNGYQNPKLEFIIDQNKKPAPKPAEPALNSEPPKAPSAETFSGGLNQKFTFANFIVGSNNDLAFGAAQRVAEKPGEVYNPLFIYGGVGLGKTHLIQAVGQAIKQGCPNAKVLYLTADEFMSDFTKHIRGKNVAAFQSKYRKCDVLIVDDIQFIAGKEKIEEEFFNTFNALYLKNKQIILAADRHPSAISGLTDRVQSRLGMGMTIDIHLPSLEVRRAIIENKAEEKQVQIEPDAVAFLAENIKTNVRELEGILTPILARCEIQGLTADLDLVRMSIGGLQNIRTKHITTRQIITKTASYFDIKPEELCSPARDKHIATPRHIASYLMRTELSESYPNIAKAVGRKDHTTIMSSFKKINREIQLDINLREQINEVRERLYA